MVLEEKNNELTLYRKRLVEAASPGVLSSSSSGLSPENGKKRNGKTKLANHGLQSMPGCSSSILQKIIG